MRQRSNRLATACVALALATLAAAGYAGSSRHDRASEAGWRHPGTAFPLAASDRREQTWTLPGGKGKVVVDDVAGDVTVRGVEGDQVRLVARLSLHARQASDLELGRREMPLQLSQHGDTVIAFVDSPFRDPSPGAFGSEPNQLRGPWHDVPYRVLWDLELEVPRGAEVVLRTVLDGSIRLQGTDGRFEVHNVNGPVSVSDVGGAGSATTVNDELSVHFRRNPDGPCDFRNVNGDVDVTFQPGLAAEVRFRTMNGDGWSDFPFTVTPLRPVVNGGDRRDGRFVLKTDWHEGIRIGSGGPLLSFGTINGDVLIRRDGAKRS